MASQFLGAAPSLDAGELIQLRAMVGSALETALLTRTDVTERFRGWLVHTTLVWSASPLAFPPPLLGCLRCSVWHEGEVIETHVLLLTAPGDGHPDRWPRRTVDAISESQAPIECILSNN